MAVPVIKQSALFRGSKYGCIFIAECLKPGHDEASKFILTNISVALVYTVKVLKPIKQSTPI